MSSENNFGIVSWVSNDKALTILGHKIMLEEAVEPTDINWSY